MIKKILSVALAVCMLFSLTACSLTDSGQIKTLISDFQLACNLNDISTALDYIIPSVAEKVRVATGFLGMFTQQSEEELFLSLANWLSGEEVSDINFFTTLEIEIIDILVSEDGESATVETIVTYDLFGEQSVREAFFECTYYAEQWYISSFTMV